MNVTTKVFSKNVPRVVLRYRDLKFVLRANNSLLPLGIIFLMRFLHPALLLEIQNISKTVFFDLGPLPVCGLKLHKT